MATRIYERLQARDVVPFSRRRRVQMGGALLFAVVLPWAVRNWFGIDSADAELIRNTVIANIVSVLMATYIYRSINTFPGIQAIHSILPSVVTAYSLVLAFILFGRIEYNRVLLLSGFLGCAFWYYFIILVPQQRRPLKIGVIPFGEIDAPHPLKKAEWQALAQPQLKSVRRFDVLVADFQTDLPAEWERLLADATLAGIPVLHVKQMRESLTGCVSIEHLSENNLGSLIPDHLYLKVKLVADVTTALFTLLILSPFLVLVGVIVRLDSPGPALFCQTRVGYGGRTFTVYKFRTMKECEAGDTDRRAAAITGENDPRITRLGRFLRRSRIDELPQMINILRGEMSWIGPRPEAEILSKWYESELPFYRYRHIVRPGITGWAQVNQGHVANVSEVHTKLQYDFYYIRYFSPWLDVLIVVRTIWTVLTGFGSR